MSSIQGVKARISEISAMKTSVANRPKELFKSLLEEKLGIVPSDEATGAEAAADDSQTISGAVTDITSLIANPDEVQTGRYCIYCGEPETVAAHSHIYGPDSAVATGLYSVLGSSIYPQGSPDIMYIERAEPYMEYVQEASEKFDMPVNLILGIMKAESNFNNECVSSAGAKGLMQLMPETAEEVGVTDVFDSRQNILGSVKYITKLVERYDGDVRLALAAYNTGPGKIARHGVTSSDSEEYSNNVPQSIRDYADRVLAYAGYTI